jgi:hypothetical protein
MYSTMSDCGQYSITSGTPGSRLEVKEWRLQQYEQCGECRWCVREWPQEKNGRRVARTSLPPLRLLHHAVAFLLQLSSPTGMFDCPPAFQSLRPAGNIYEPASLHLPIMISRMFDFDSRYSLTGTPFS